MSLILHSDKYGTAGESSVPGCEDLQEWKEARGNYTLAWRYMLAKASVDNSDPVVPPSLTSSCTLSCSSVIILNTPRSVWQCSTAACHQEGSRFESQYGAFLGGGGSLSVCSLCVSIFLQLPKQMPIRLIGDSKVSDVCNLW